MDGALAAHSRLGLTYASSNQRLKRPRPHGSPLFFTAIRPHRARATPQWNPWQSPFQSPFLRFLPLKFQGMESHVFSLVVMRPASRISTNDEELIFRGGGIL